MFDGFAPQSQSKAKVPKGYDSHCNLVLGEVDETIYVVEDDDDEESEVKVRSLQRKNKLLELKFLRPSRNSQRCFLSEVGTKIRPWLDVIESVDLNSWIGDSVVLISPHASD